MWHNGQIEKRIQNICLQFHIPLLDKTIPDEFKRISRPIYNINRKQSINSEIDKSPSVSTTNILFLVGELLRTLNIMVGYLKDRCWQDRH
jgi:hypothetical protein